MKKIENELRNRLTFIYKLEPIKLRDALAKRMNIFRGIPYDATLHALQAVEDQMFGQGSFLKRYKVRFSLANPRVDRYREISVLYEYNPLVWADRSLRFRCYLLFTERL